jgi:hypothetical protein
MDAGRAIPKAPTPVFQNGNSLFSQPFYWLRKLPYLVDSSKLEFSAYRSMYSAGVICPSE